MASTPFLTDLARTVAEDVQAGEPGVPTLRTFLCAGAPIPGPLVEQARAALGAKIVSAWGMTENGAVTLIKLDDDDERSFNTDGCPLPGVEIKVVDADGSQPAVRRVGQAAAALVLQLWRLPQAPAAQRHRRRGLVRHRRPGAHRRAGYVRITGRSKDVIIRGGENIPVVEIESLLYRHPAVAMAAIVAYPDERLGERACAVVVPKAGQSIDLPEIQRFLKEQQVAVQYMPERLIVQEAIPSTPSGKIQKFKLRDAVQELLRNSKA